MKLSVYTLFLVAFGAAVAHSQGATFVLCATNTNHYNYLDPGQNNSKLTELNPAPPPSDAESAKERARLVALQTTRTQTQVLQARTDANELDMFIFKSLLGSEFTDTNFAFSNVLALSQRVCEDANAVVSYQKNLFNRKRPFVVDSAIITEIDTTALKDSPSYPSGHSLISYVEGLVLSDLCPDKRAEILKRAEEFGFERNLVGVHYFSDVEAGHVVAIKMHDKLLSNPAFKADLEAARGDLKKAAGSTGTCPIQNF